MYISISLQNRGQQKVHINYKQKNRYFNQSHICKSCRKLIKTYKILQQISTHQRRWKTAVSDATLKIPGRTPHIYFFFLNNLVGALIQIIQIHIIKGQAAGRLRTFGGSTQNISAWSQTPQPKDYPAHTSLPSTVLSQAQYSDSPLGGSTPR